MEPSEKKRKRSIPKISFTLAVIVIRPGVIGSIHSLKGILLFSSFEKSDYLYGYYALKLPINWLYFEGNWPLFGVFRSVAIVEGVKLG